MERIPAVRCYTCGKILKRDTYENLTRTMTPQQAYEKMGLRRYCCRARITHIPVQATREIYATQEVSRNVLPPRPEFLSNQVSSLPPS